MPETTPTLVAIWRELGEYLNTETEVGETETVSFPAHADPARKRPHEVVHFRVRFSNTAPDWSDMPRIVFTGLGLGVVPTHDRDARHRFSTREPDWAVRHSWVERPKRTLQSRTVVGASGGGIGGPKRWEDLTHDESEHGMALFPGESATLELTIPVDDIPDYEFHVQGSVSRRHFFHYDRSVSIKQA